MDFIGSLTSYHYLTTFTLVSVGCAILDYLCRWIVDAYRKLMSEEGRDSYRFKMFWMGNNKLLMLVLMWVMVGPMDTFCATYPGPMFAVWSLVILGKFLEGAASLTHYVRQWGEVRNRHYERFVK